jgi:hypothetical protein
MLWFKHQLIKSQKMVLRDKIQFSLVKSVLLFAVLLFTFDASSQNTVRIVIKEKHNAQTIIAGIAVRAIVIKAGENILESLVIETAEGFYKPVVDEHYWPENAVYHSNPIIFKNPLESFAIHGIIESDSIEIVLIHWDEQPQHEKDLFLKTACNKPEMILQHEWRAGLPDPDYERVWNQVRNIILHHSATSNNLTDYTAIVRSIYTYHTQVNEWSDIGYNYLIAPDGSIFAGRDPGELFIDDEVLGAHFCSSNTGTLGICLLGTFTTTEPSTAALQSLNKLLAWKTAKDSLSPYALNAHPLNQQLGVIAAHRHGCATTCPGDGFLALFDAIRHKCNTTLENCGVFLSIPEELASNALQIIPNPVSDDNFELQMPPGIYLDVFLTDIHGSQVPFEIAAIHNNKLYIQAVLPPGVYIVAMVTKSAVYSQKLIRL